MSSPRTPPEIGLSSFWHLVRRRPNFRRVWLSEVVSQLGDWLSFIAVSVLALRHESGALTVALVFVAHTLPHALAAPLAGPIADRIDRRTLLVGARILAGILTLGMWQAAEHGAIYVLQALLVLRVGVSALTYTARSAALPSLVERDELHAANALSSLSWSALFALGVALGGLLAGLIGPRMAILVDAGTFVVAALLLTGLPSLPPPKSQPDERPKLVSVRDLYLAWRHARTHPSLTAAVLAKVPIALPMGAAWVSLNMVADARLVGWTSAAALGAFHAVRGAGTGIGPLLPQRWLPQRAHAASPLVFIGVVVFALADGWFLTALGSFVWGLGMGHNWVASTSFMQREAPTSLLGRFTALDVLLFTVVESAAALGAGLLIDVGFTPGAVALIGTGMGVPLWFWLVMLEQRGLREVAVRGGA